MGGNGLSLGRGGLLTISAALRACTRAKLAFSTCRKLCIALGFLGQRHGRNGNQACEGKQNWKKLDSHG